MVTVAVLVCGVEYSVPSNSECIFRCFELPLLLFQATRSGDEPFVEVLVLQQLVRCEIVRTVIFAGDRLFIQIVLFDGCSIACSSSTGSPCSMVGYVWLLSLSRRDFERRLRRRFDCFSRELSFAGDGLFGLFIQVALFGWLLDGMFVVRRFALLCGWVFVEVGFGAALTPPL